MVQGPTSAAVAANILQLRNKSGWSLRELSDRIPRESSGWMSHVTIGWIERGRRQPNVDELTALSVVFGVSPIRLLTPPDPYENPLPTRDEELTGTGPVTAAVMFDWLRGDHPLPGLPGPDRKCPTVGDFQKQSRPWWFQNDKVKEYIR